MASRSFVGQFVWCVMLVAFPRVTSWVALSKDGYVVKQDISLNNGVLVEGDMLVNGVVRSANYTWLGPDDPDMTCRSSRRGAVRWSLYGDFESCDGATWVPIKLCDRHCGFIPPPLPTIRPERTSNATCRLTDCPLKCIAINIFNRTAPNVTEELCNRLFEGREECGNLTTSDPEVGSIVLSEFLGSDFTVCQGSFEPVCTDYEADTYCTTAPRPSTPIRENPGLFATSFMYYFVTSAIVTTNGTISGVAGRIIQLEMNAELEIQRIYFHGEQLTWEQRMLVWDIRSDPESLRDGALLFLGQQITTPWAATTTRLDSETSTFVDPGGTSCAKILNNTEDPRLDYLRVFYNVSGWPSLLWNESGLRRRELDRPIPNPCEGEQRFPTPWSWYDREDPPDVRGFIDTGAYQPTAGGTNTSSSGKLCRFVVEPPIGFVVRVRILRVGLAPEHSIRILDHQQYPEEPTTLLFNFTESNVTHPNRTSLNGKEVLGSSVSRAVSIELETTGQGKGSGFSVEYEFVSRQAFMREQGNATLLQFALAVLEAQGASMPAFGWRSVRDSRHVPVGPPPGDISLGPMTAMEQCFLCCFLGEDFAPGEEAARRYQESKSDDSGLHPPWAPRTAEGADVGTTVAAPSMRIEDTEVPPLVAYAGYSSQHFVRTAFVSSYPPGSVRAPFGSQLGERPDFDVDSGQDVPERPAVGWGMRSILVQEGSSFEDPENPGWGSGWGFGTRAGMGTHWRDGDGASAAWFPSWQVLVSQQARSTDERRLGFDLDSADLPLFSFVDADRRIVMANEMALAIPCGMEVNNTCGVSCEVVGTGLNLLQCLKGVETTKCLQPVVDACNNECGITGTLQCVDSLKPLSLRVTAMNETQSTSNFELAVGMKIDLNDGLTRSQDISGLGIVGVAVGDGDGAGWVHPSTSERLVSPVDNSLLISFRDPAQDGLYETNINGNVVEVFFSRQDILTMQNGRLDIPLPRECFKGVDDCKFRTPIDDVSLQGEWYNASFTPWWDADEDKRVSFSEMGQIINRNLRVLSLIFLEELGACRDEPVGGLCALGLQTMQFSLIKEFGFVGSEAVDPGSTAPSCRHLSDGEVAACFLSVFNLEHMRATIEGKRRRTLRSIGERPRFNMAKIRRIPGAGGLEFTSPDPTLEKVENHNTNTLRVSSSFEALGEYVRIGSSRHLNVSVCRNFTDVLCYDNTTASGVFPYSDGLLSIASGWSRHVSESSDPNRAGFCSMTFCEWNASLDLPTLSHVFFTGIIKEKAPFRFDGGSMGNGSTHLVVEGKRHSVLGRERVERPQVHPNQPNTASNMRVITLPDRSGRVITTGNLDEVKRLPGLRAKRPSPYRYDNASVKELDDARIVAGTRHWYKRMLGGDSDGECETFDDGTTVSCPSLKVQYDVLEASGSSGDELVVYTGDFVIQGTQLTSVPPSMTTEPRLDCSPMQTRCGSDNLMGIGVAEFRLIPKGIPVCVALDRQIWDEIPIQCSYDNPGSCNGAIQLSVCTNYPIWGQELDGNVYQLEWASLAQFRGKGVFSSEWQIDFDYESAIVDVSACSDVADLMDSTVLDFLHVYYGTERGAELLGELETVLELAGEQRQRNETSLRWYALKYLDLQGVAKIEVGRDPVQSFIVQTALVSDNAEAQELAWATSLLESCFACCLRNQEAQELLAEQAPLPACGWINVSGTTNPQNQAVEGAYRQLEQTSFGRPVWKQDPGELYMHFLPSACTSFPDCGPGADPQLSNSGPAWVLGPEVGKDVIVLFAHLPDNQGMVNGTYFSKEDAEERNLLVNTSKGFSWYNPSYLRAGHADVFNGTWSWHEHREVDLSVYGVNDTIFGERWFQSSPHVSIFCSDVPLYRYATSAILFADAVDFRKISLPDADGTIISKGNLEMVTEVGIQASPILGRSREVDSTDTKTTRIKFGVGWQTVKITPDNDLLSWSVAARHLSYCAARRSVCEYSHPPPETTATDVQERECYPLSVDQVDCPWPGGSPLPDHNYGVDGLLLPDKNSEVCMSFFPAHEWYDGQGVFESVGDDVKCFGEIMEGLVSLDSAEYAQETSPTYWGLQGASSCPQTAEYLGEDLGTPTEMCVGLLRAGCQDACLRDPACVGARFYWQSFQCQKIFSCPTTVPKESNERWEDWNKTAGGWAPSRLKRRRDERGVGLGELEVGATLVLHDMPSQSWVVDGEYRVREPCPIHLASQDVLTTEKCDAWHAADHPLRVSWNMTATHRYRICVPNGTAVPSDGLTEAALEHEVFLLADLNSTENSSLALVSNAAALVDVETVRINTTYYSVLQVDVERSLISLGNSPAGDSVFVNHPTNSTVVPVLGGYFNSTRQWEHRVPHGVYALENITEILNHEISSHGADNAWELAFRIREPGAGLCGEVAAGTSHDVQQFHCAPASRFLELVGAVSPTPYSDSNVSDFGSVDDHVQVTQNSTILRALGLALPETSYTFARPMRATVPNATLRHEVLPGAGFLSSGYGEASGFGKGGQEGWEGFVPPTREIDPEPYAVWCHDGFGFQCFDADCQCSSHPVLTVSRLLGATRSQRGETPQSNTLRIPSNGDGIIVSTGNLEDITVESEAMTGLRIDALKEHAQGLAAQVGGWLQFSACASLFGDGDCSLISDDDVSIRVGTSGQISVHSYHDTTFWVAIYNASAELHAAAMVQDTTRAWELLPSQLQSINRTFAALQDVAGVESAAAACLAYCDDLTIRQRAEAEAATKFLADAEVRMPASVWRTSRDPQAFCTAAECPANGVTWSVTQFADPLYECGESAFCAREHCTCAGRLRCNQLWDGARPTSLANSDPWEYAESWELCTRSLSLEKNLTDFCNCTDFNYTNPNSEPSCCFNENLLNNEAILREKTTDALESYEMFAMYEFMVGWEVVQWRETLQVCNCIELEGFTFNPDGGKEDVVNHLCAVGDQRYTSPVCESGGGNISIGANGSTTATFLHVESPVDRQNNYLTVPSAHGVILTTGNLDAVTKEAGSMSSLHVSGESLFQQEVLIGTVGQQAASQGSRFDEDRTTVYTDVNSSFCQGTQVSDTAHACDGPHLEVSLHPKSISLEDGAAFAEVTSASEIGNWTLDFPTWDDNLCVGEERSGCNPREGGLASLQGTVITTGNLKDVIAMSPNLVDTAGDANLEGEVRLGSSHACHPEGRSLYGSSYTRFGWRAHTAAECVEAKEEVDWNDAAKVRTGSVKQCKAWCEADPSCEVLVVDVTIDRYPADAETRCILLVFPERKCTLASNPAQDTYLLQRKAPSPWLDTIADDNFFAALCDERFNATHVPGVPVRLDGYLRGDLLWRAQPPMAWSAYPQAKCDAVDQTRVTRIDNATLEACKSQCESLKDCGAVTYHPEKVTEALVDVGNPLCINGSVVLNATNASEVANSTNSSASICNDTLWAWNYTVVPPRCFLSPLVSQRRVLSNGSTVQGLCTIVASESTDLHVFTRNEHVRLSFQIPTGSNNLEITDSSGVIITTGNTYDMDRTIGASGQDSWVLNHPHTAGLANFDLDQDVLLGTVRSGMSGVAESVVVRNCGQNGLSCDVYASIHVSDEDLQREIATHVTGRHMTVNKLVRGEDSGFDDFKTIVDFAVPGSRTSGECFGECKGSLTCQRGTTSCTDNCPGYMRERPGVDMTLPCTQSGSRGEVCGCANGEAFGQFGTAVCVMRNSSHPDHGRYCATTTGAGDQVFMYDCCLDPAHCGDCVMFPPHKPVGRNNRITFPQATGVVVTTGNIDDVVLKNIQLEGLNLKGFVDLGIGYPRDTLEPTLGAPSGYRYDRNQDQARAHLDLHPVSTRVTGGLRMVSGFGSPNKLYGTGTQEEVPGTAQSELYTHLFTEPPTALAEPFPQHAERYCVESVAFDWRDSGDPQQQEWERDFRRRCGYKREILIPPTSGTVLTVENLDDVPAIAVPVEGLVMESINSSFIVEGNLTFGKVVNYTTDPFNNGGYGVADADRVRQAVARLYNQFDGDVGLTMQSASDRIPLLPSTQGLSSLPDYGKNVVGESPYSDPPFSGPSPFGGPAPAQVIEDFAREGRKGDGEERSFALDYVRISMPQGGGVDTAARTYLRGGAPRLPVSVQDARSVPSEPNQLSDHFAYRSGEPVLQQRSITMPSAADSYSPAVDGSPREPNQALHGSTPVNVTWCYKTLVNLPAVDPSNNVAGVRTLSMFMSFMVERGFLVPTLLAGTLLRSGPNTTDPLSLAARAFDADLSTVVGVHGRCNLELDLGEGNAADVSVIRYAAGEGYEWELVGGKFQGSSDNVTYTDLIEVVDLPLGPVYVTATNYQRGAFRFLRFLGPTASTGCHVSEIEFHRGEIEISLSELQHGRVSWRVDEEELFRRDNVEAAMLVKCAAHGMVPSMLDNEVQELILPEAQGQIITSGNLADISLEKGSFTSVNVAGELEVDGDVTLGVPGRDALLVINSRLDSSSFFSFGGPSVEVGAQTALLTNAMFEDAITSMPDVSGTLALGELPSVVHDVLVMEEAGLDLDWNTDVRARLQLGVVNQPDAPGSVQINAHLGSSTPLVLDGAFSGDDAATTIGAPDPSSDTILTLPDASGTILTTASAPHVLDNVTAINGQVKGTAKFHDSDVEIGREGEGDGMAVHAQVLGLGALLFDGSTRKDGRTLTLSALDPDADAELTLPDTTGTVITSANFPRKFDSLRALGAFEVKGAAAHNGELLTVGRAGGRSTLAIRAQISGRAPLLFDGGLLGAALDARRTSFLMPDSSRDHLVTFPDTSGTVVTTSNQPSRIVTDGRYSVDAVFVTVAADTLLFGLGVVDNVTAGSFAFSDLDGKQYNHRPDRRNQFSTHCSGGAVFVTGETRRGRTTGATLAAKASAWSYVSDREAKEGLAAVNGSALLEALRGVEVSRWRYDVEGGGGAEHVGPMAQALHDAFGVGGDRERIGGSDADGIVLAAIHGLHSKVEALRRQLARAREAAREQERVLAEQEAEMRARQARIDENQLRLQSLWRAAQDQGVTVL